MDKARNKPNAASRPRTSEARRPPIRPVSMRRRGFLDQGELFAALNHPPMEEEQSASADAPIEKDVHVVRIMSKMTACNDGDNESKFPASRVRKSLKLLSEADLQQVEDEMDFFAFTGIKGERMGQLFPFIKLGLKK